MENKKIEMTEDIEYFLNRAKNSIKKAIVSKDPLMCLSSLIQAEVSIRSHIIHLQSKEDDNTNLNYVLSS